MPVPTGSLVPPTGCFLPILCFESEGDLGQTPAGKHETRGLKDGQTDGQCCRNKRSRPLQAPWRHSMGLHSGFPEA